MFECASPIPTPSPFERYLVEYDWNLEENARLFTQVNQSDVLSEFLNVVLSPLRDRDDGSAATSADSAALPYARSRRKVFVSYAHGDRRWLDRLRVHLKPLERDGLVDVWDDTRIAAGDDWRAEIARSIDSAGVAVLLISADFLASDFIYRNELPPLLDAAQNRGVLVLSIIVGASQFTEIPSLMQFQAVNPPSRPLQDMRSAEREHIFVAVGKRIRQVLS